MMKKIKSILNKLISICIWAIIFSCGSLSSGESQKPSRKEIKQIMNDFINQEIEESFVLKNFYSSGIYHYDTKTYIGIYQSEADPRLEVLVPVGERDNFQSILEPELALKRYRNLKYSLAISDKVRTITEQFFNPDFINTIPTTGVGNNKIYIYKKDKLSTETLAEYNQYMKVITEEISRKIPEVHKDDFDVSLQLFMNEIKTIDFEPAIGASFSNQPDGDYVIKTKINEDNSVNLKSSIGFNSQLEKGHKKVIAKMYQLSSLNPVHNHYSYEEKTFPEDLDENGVRHYNRYYVVIYKDEAHEEVILKEFLKINIFTGEISKYTPKNNFP